MNVNMRNLNTGFRKREGPIEFSAGTSFYPESNHKVHIRLGSKFSTFSLSFWTDLKSAKRMAEALCRAIAMAQEGTKEEQP